MIKLQEKNGVLDLTKKMLKGDPGGYYTPEVDEEGNLSWIESEEDMAPVAPSNIRGPKGEVGPNSVYVGPEDPGEAFDVWINPTGEGETDESLATKEYVDSAVANVKVDLTGYATEEYVETAIANANVKVDLTGYATEEYVDSAVSNVKVDLTGYATEEYVDSAISTIELTPGPKGDPGEPGADYVLTDTDKTDIAELVIELLPNAEEVSV